MKCPYEQLGGTSQKVCFVPIDVINPDGSKTPATMKMPVAAFEKIKDLASSKGKKPGMKDKEPNIQSVPPRSADARRIKAAFNPLPDSEGKREQFFKDVPIGERLSDMPLDQSLYSSKDKKQTGPRKDYDGMVLRDYQKPPRLNDPHIGLPPANAEDIKKILDHFRNFKEGDELLVGGDFADGAVLKSVKAPKMIHASTPTGRTEPNYASLLSENVRENWRRIQMDFDVDEPGEPVHRQLFPYFAEAAFRAGRDIGKMKLNHGLFAHQLEALRNVRVMGFDPGHKDSLVGITCFEGGMDSFTFDIEANVTQQFRPMVINPLPRRIRRESLAFGGHADMLDPNWLRLDYTNDPDYRRLKALYSGEEIRSKIKDEKKRHEAICKKLLQPYKKRRKALRKLLDQAAADLKTDRTTPQA